MYKALLNLLGLEKRKEIAGLNKSQDVSMQFTSVKEQTCILSSAFFLNWSCSPL